MLARTGWLSGCEGAKGRPPTPMPPPTLPQAVRCVRRARPTSKRRRGAAAPRGEGSLVEEAVVVVAAAAKKGTGRWATCMPAADTSAAGAGRRGSCPCPTARSGQQMTRSGLPRCRRQHRPGRRRQPPTQQRFVRWHKAPRHRRRPRGRKAADNRAREESETWTVTADSKSNVGFGLSGVAIPVRPPSSGLRVRPSPDLRVGLPSRVSESDRLQIRAADSGWDAARVRVGCCRSATVGAEAVSLSRAFHHVTELC